MYPGLFWEAGRGSRTVPYSILLEYKMMLDMLHLGRWSVVYMLLKIPKATYSKCLK